MKTCSIFFVLHVYFLIANVSDIKERRNMKILNLDRKDLFNVKIQDTIDENDLFYEDVMVPAAFQLNIILENCYVSPDLSLKYDRKENPNNILAFIGDRGQGKTSTMLTFEKQLLKCEQSLFGENIKYYHFESLGIIDPSTFEEGSNVLEIILGRMYRFFVDRDEELFSSGIAQKNSKEIRKELIDLFKKAYNYLSVLSDKKVISKDSIYEQSLDSLLLLGDSTSLKMILLELINKYLSFMNNRNKDKKNILIITIDDLDLDVSHSYEIIEQIRKYLILPNVIILLSTKIEQLHKGIRSEYSKYLDRNDNEEDEDDAYRMATTYLRKMIPESRRLYLPTLRSDVEDLYINKFVTVDDTKHTSYALDNYVVELVYKKTGIYLINYGDKKRYLLSGNLREYLELISFLSNLEDIIGSETSNSIALKNLMKFREFFVFNWCATNLTRKEFGYIKQLNNYSTFFKNRKTIKIIQNILAESKTVEIKEFLPTFKKKGIKDINYSIADVQIYLVLLRNNDFRIKMKNNDKFIYSFQFFYTILLHQLIVIDEELEFNYSGGITARDINNVSKELGGKVRDYKVKNYERVHESLAAEKIGELIFPVKFEHDGKTNEKKSDSHYILMLFMILLVKKIDYPRDMVLYSYESWANFDLIIDFNDIFFRGLDIKYSMKLFCDVIKERNEAITIIKDFENNSVYKRYASVIKTVSEFILCNYDVYIYYYERKKITMNAQSFQEAMLECINWNKTFLEDLNYNAARHFELEMMQDLKRDIQLYIRFLDQVKTAVNAIEGLKAVNINEIVLYI